MLFSLDEYTTACHITRDALYHTTDEREAKELAAVIDGSYKPVTDGGYVVFTRGGGLVNRWYCATEIAVARERMGRN